MKIQSLSPKLQNPSQPSLVSPSLSIPKPEIHWQNVDKAARTRAMRAKDLNPTRTHKNLTTALSGLLGDTPNHRQARRAQS